MKRLLSWFVLLLVTVHLFSVAADNCEGVLSKGPDGAVAITAQVVDVSAVVNVQDQTVIQIYMNLDEANDIVCTGDDGNLDIGSKCKITYKFNMPDTTHPTGAITFAVNGKPTPPNSINYDAEAPHQAVMTIQKTGISFRGPMDDADLPVADTEFCMPTGGTLELSKFKAPGDSCILQLELKSPLSVVTYTEGGQECTLRSDMPPIGSTTTNKTPETPGTGSTTTTSTTTGPDPVSPGTGSTTTTSVTPGPGPVPPGTGSTTTTSGQPADQTTPSSPDTTTEPADNLVIIIVSVVVGVILLLVIIGMVVFCCCFRKKKEEEDAEAGEGEDHDAEAEAEGTQGSDAKEPEAADGPEAENTQRDSEKKVSDKTQSEGADNTQGE